jgi:hypothetical protein
LFLALIFACGSRDKYVGSYVADPKDTPKQTETSLELKENGEGIWKIGDEEVLFSWGIRQNELRVNTKGGGVIVGSLENNVISLSLPGSKTMTFRRVQ